MHLKKLFNKIIQGVKPTQTEIHKDFLAAKAKGGI
jgi:hypothetical protein